MTREESTDGWQPVPTLLGRVRAAARPYLSGRVCGLGAWRRIARRRGKNPRTGGSPHRDGRRPHLAAPHAVGYLGRQRPGEGDRRGGGSGEVSLRGRQTRTPHCCGPRTGVFTACCRASRRQTARTARARGKIPRGGIRRASAGKMPAARSANPDRLRVDTGRTRLHAVGGLPCKQPTVRTEIAPTWCNLIVICAEFISVEEIYWRKDGIIWRRLSHVHTTSSNVNS